eukprot:CAMPEP_0181196820 /NCGR_PEP_ID=MMETSP1096-20121128/15677_1 /TAXON_ID=156174 ORGANISM="Chrysochromulina ericina, Strain CCMP281" /NCGR_SAMPLE_ID=MMETSP1096 /ASSEMBLY_ACC=CAM_ASM_000453 /LENGTH=182 /DNA_ID=CAMNT_0023286621 /DNA_START=222 /DNA_END=772 /DNA_ORIENTATION=+
MTGPCSTRELGVSILCREESHSTVSFLSFLRPPRAARMQRLSPGRGCASELSRAVAHYATPFGSSSDGECTPQGMLTQERTSPPKLVGKMGVVYDPAPHPPPKPLNTADAALARCDACNAAWCCDAWHAEHFMSTACTLAKCCGRDNSAKRRHSRRQRGREVTSLPPLHDTAVGAELSDRYA